MLIRFKGNFEKLFSPALRLAFIEIYKNIPTSFPKHLYPTMNRIKVATKKNAWRILDTSDYRSPKLVIDAIKIILKDLSKKRK